MNPADWLKTVPVGEPDEDGERAQVPVALTRMTPEEVTAWAAAFNNASPEQIAQAQVRSLQHLLDEQGRELAALREAAGALLRGLLDTLSDGALWECDYLGKPGADDCEGIATVRAYDEPDTTDLCGHCAERLDRSHLEDRPHAAPLRTLRALLGGAS